MPADDAWMGSAKWIECLSTWSPERLYAQAAAEEARQSRKGWRPFGAMKAIPDPVGFSARREKWLKLSRQGGVEVMFEMALEAVESTKETTSAAMVRIMAKDLARLCPGRDESANSTNSMSDEEALDQRRADLAAVLLSTLHTLQMEYRSGMLSLCAFCFLVMGGDRRMTYDVLVFVIGRVLRPYYLDDGPLMGDSGIVLLSVIRDNSPDIYEHLREQEASNLTLISVGWFMLGFVTFVPVGIALRLWDKLLQKQSVKTILKFAVALVVANEHALLQIQGSNNIIKYIQDMPWATINSTLYHRLPHRPTAKTVQAYRAFAEKKQQKDQQADMLA